MPHELSIMEGYSALFSASKTIRLNRLSARKIEESIPLEDLEKRQLASSFSKCIGSKEAYEDMYVTKP